MNKKKYSLLILILLISSLSNLLNSQEIPSFLHTDVTRDQITLSIEAEDFVYNEDWILVVDKTRRTTGNQYMKSSEKGGIIHYKFNSEFKGKYNLLLNINDPDIEISLNKKKIKVKFTAISNIPRRYIVKWFILNDKITLEKGENYLKISANKSISFDSILFVKSFDKSLMNPSNLFEASKKIRLPSPLKVTYKIEEPDKIDPVLSGYMLAPANSIIQYSNRPAKFKINILANPSYPVKSNLSEKLRLIVSHQTDMSRNTPFNTIMDIKTDLKLKKEFYCPVNFTGLSILRSSIYNNENLLWFRKYYLITIEKDKIQNPRFDVFQKNLCFPGNVIVEEKIIPWNELWEGDETNDIIITFPRNDTQFVFWKGASFCPLWIFEGSGFTSQWFEVVDFTDYKSKLRSCFEPLQDRKCEFSTVIVTEKTNSRISVEWKYPILEFPGKKLPGNITTEIYRFYPDGIGVRNINMNVNENIKDYQIIEFIVVNFPGTLGSDNINANGIDFWVDDNIRQKINWTPEIEGLDNLRKLNFENVTFRINLKDKSHIPFIVVPGKQKLDFTPGSFGSLGYKAVDNFSTWRHWPLSRGLLTVNSGLQSFWDSYAGPTHSSLGNVYPQSVGNKIDFPILIGTVQKDDEDAMLAHANSWLHPADIEPISNVTFEGYEKAQRAYIMNAKNPDQNISFKFNPPNNSEIMHPVFIINNFKHQKIVINDNNRIVSDNLKTIGVIDNMTVVFLELYLGKSDLFFDIEK